MNSSRNKRVHQFICGVALTILLMGIGGQAVCAQTRNVQEAIDIIVMFCVAGGSKSEVSGSENISIARSDARGLVDGLRNAMSNTTAAQASEARRCMQPYIDRILNMLGTPTSGDADRRPIIVGHPPPIGNRYLPGVGIAPVGYNWCLLDRRFWTNNVRSYCWTVQQSGHCNCSIVPPGNPQPSTASYGVTYDGANR